MSESPLIIRIMQQQAGEISSTLSALLSGDQQRQQLEQHAVTQDDLDRKQAYENDWEQLQEVLHKPTHDSVAAACMIVQQQHRIRRDMKIVKATHRDLITAGLSTLYARQKALQTQAQETGSYQEEA